MEKQYNVFDLYVVKVKRNNNTYQYFICTKEKFTNKYIEVFTKIKFEIKDNTLIKNLSDYYPLISLADYKTGKPLMLSEQDLLYKYNEINYVNILKEHDEEKIKEELDRRGVFEESVSYKKRLNKIFN